MALRAGQSECNKSSCLILSGNGNGTPAPKPQRFSAWGAAWSLGLPFTPGSCGHPHWFIRVHRPLNPAINTPAEVPWTGHALSCIFHLPVGYGALLERRDEGWQGWPCDGCPPTPRLFPGTLPPCPLPAGSLSLTSRRTSSLWSLARGH